MLWNVNFTPFRETLVKCEVILPTAAPIIATKMKRQTRTNTALSEQVQLSRQV